MVAKKRTQLRSKAAKISKLGKAVEDSEQIDLPPDPNAFLNVQRESKKDKLVQKSQSFRAKIMDQGKNGGISKSSLRRRKRKLRDELKPKMNDLLHSLGDEVSISETDKSNGIDLSAERSDLNKSVAAVTRISSSAQYKAFSQDALDDVGHVEIRKNEPNIRNQKGAKTLAKQESKRFNEVLSTESFQQNPFQALREAIKMRK